MKFLKNNLKVIIAFILGLILASGIVYAATSAREVTYTTAKNEEIKNVEDALNDLYNRKSYTKGKFSNNLNERSFIELGFKPSVIIMITRNSANNSNNNIMYYYNSSIDNNNLLVGWDNRTSNVGCRYLPMSYYNFSVTDNGFYMQANDSPWIGETIYYAFN